MMHAAWTLAVGGHEPVYDMSTQPVSYMVGAQLSVTRDTEVGPVCLDCWYWQVHAREGLFHVNLSCTIVDCTTYLSTITYTCTCSK